MWGNMARLAAEYIFLDALFDYDPAGLTAAMQSGDPMALAKAATDRFNLVSSDLAFGHVRGEDQIGYVVPEDDEPAIGSTVTVGAPPARVLRYDKETGLLVR